MKLDYSVLEEIATPEDIKNYLLWHQSQKTSTSKLNRELPLVFVVMAFLLIVILYAASLFILKAVEEYLGFSPAFFGLLYAFLPAGIFVIILIFAARRWKHSIKDSSVLNYKFAKKNGIKYEENILNPDLRGWLFNRGRLRQLTELYTFPDGMKVGNYQYYEQGDRYEVKLTWNFACINLPKSLPHLLVDSRKNNFFDGKTNLPMELKGQRLSLEGDFDKFFTLYIQKQYERDALYILTPDVMAKMIDKGQAYDIEIINNQLYLYSEGHLDLAGSNNFSQLADVIITLKNEIYNQASRYSDERLAN